MGDLEKGKKFAWNITQKNANELCLTQDPV